MPNMTLQDLVDAITARPVEPDRLDESGNTGTGAPVVPAGGHSPTRIYISPNRELTGNLVSGVWQPEQPAPIVPEPSTPQIAPGQVYQEVVSREDAPSPQTEAVLAAAAASPAVPVTPVAGQEPITPPQEAPAPSIDNTDAVKQLQALAAQPAQEIKAADEAPPAVANQAQGLTGDLEPQTSVQQGQQPEQLADVGTPIEKGKNIIPPAGPPAVPISGPSPLPSGAVTLPTAPTPPAQPNFIQEVMQQVRQAGSGLLSKATATPFQVGAALTAAVAAPARKMGFEGPANLVQTLQNQAEKMKQGADFATGANPNPSTPGQQLARIVGQNANPSGLMTAAMTGGDLLSRAITPSPASAKDAPMDRPTAEKLLTVPNQVLPPKGPRVSHTMTTAGGPAKVSDGELSMLGVIGAITIGAIFAPRVIAAISKTPLPVFRPVENAKPGTMAMSNRMDLARTYDDVNAGVFRLARRAGVDPLTLANVQDTFRIQTGGAARNMVNSAVLNGEMQTPNFTFKTQTSIADLAKKDSPEFRDYLHARDTFDDIVRKEQIVQNKGKNAVAQQAAAGPVKVRGMTKQDALDLVNNLERAYPDLKNLGALYRDNTKEMRKFLATGEYSTISRKNFTKLQKESSNYVPWRDETGRTRVFGDDVDRLSPFDTLKEEMQATMRHRMENEAKGLYIDEMRKVQPELYKKVTTEELTANPNWKRNTVSFYRRGRLEQYTTDPFLADLHNLDPQGSSGVIAMGLYASKRLMESTATGVLAPWFAVTSALRSWQIGKITSGAGKPPTFVGSTLAVPRQLYPQLARSVAESLQNGSGGWLGQVLGPQTMQALSIKLADVYEKSLYAQLERSGTHQGSFLQHAQQFTGAIDKALGNATGASKTFLTGYKQLLNAIHNSPSFDFASKNYGTMPVPKLAMEARHLTGDPMVAGQFTRDGKRPIRMDKPLFGSELAGKAANLPVKGYGFLTGVGREAIPWWNITTQGAKRIGEAYVENPAKFVAKAYMYQMAPAAALFMYTRGMGKDQNGHSYADYMMNGRGEYAKLMNWYIPIPGRPVEEGAEVPRFHELTIAAHGMEVALDHMVRSDVFSNGEDFMRAALSFIGAKDTFPHDNGGAIFSPTEDAKTLASAFNEAAIVPPTPPIVNAPLAVGGMVAPQGIFGGGEMYKKKQDPYDQLGGMNATVELVARALGTGMADVIGSGYAAYTQTPEGVGTAVKNAMTEAGKRMVTKTPIVRNAFDIVPPASGNTHITEELFRKEKVLNDLSKYYRTWTKAGGAISLKMASESGGRTVNNLLGDGPPSESGGLHQPPPTNPLYQSFMEEVYNKFNKDSPEKKVDPVTGMKSGKKDAVWVPDEDGGLGVKSMWRRYGDYSVNLKRLRQINDGNNVTWQMQLSERPEQLKYLKDNNIDYKSLRDVRNFYEAKRQEVARQLLFTIRAVEEDFSSRLGKPFHIEDLDPYAKGPQAGEVISEQPTIPPWTDGLGTN